MLAIDWSYQKGLAIYDGKKASVVDRKSLLKKLAGAGNLLFKLNLNAALTCLRTATFLAKELWQSLAGESKESVQSKVGLNSARSAKPAE